MKGGPMPKALDLVTTLFDTKPIPDDGWTGVFQIKDETSSAVKELRFLLEEFHSKHCGITLWSGEEVFLQTHVDDPPPTDEMKLVIKVIFMSTVCQTMSWAPNVITKTPPIHVSLGKMIQEFIS